MAQNKSSKAHQDKARAAATKPATFGEDIDLDSYVGSADEQPYQTDPSKLPPAAKQRML